MMVFSMRQVTPRRAAGLGACVALAIAAVALVAGCGSSSSSKAAAKTSGRTVQVLATVRRGNLTQSVTGTVRSAAKRKVVALVTGQNAGEVAVGQSVTLVFFQRPSGTGQGSFGQGNGQSSGGGQPQGGQASGQPQAGQSGQPQAGQNGQPQAGQNGQGFFGGQGAGGQGALRGGKTVQGKVTLVRPGSNGAVTATIAIAKLPSGVTAKYIGIAQIQVKVLASNVLIIPTAAIKGTGSSATVQVLASGKTSTQGVVVGQQAGGDSEITSGLSAGQNVVYTRTFTGRFPGSRTNGQSGGQGLPPGGQSGGQGLPPGGQSGATSGA